MERERDRDRDRETEETETETETEREIERLSQLRTILGREELNFCVHGTPPLDAELERGMSVVIVFLGPACHQGSLIGRLVARRAQSTPRRKRAVRDPERPPVLDTSPAPPPPPPPPHTHTTPHHLSGVFPL